MSSLLTGIDLSNIPDAPAKDAPGAVVEPLAGLDLSIIPDAPTPAAGLKDAWASTEGTKPDDAATALNHWANTGADPGATLADPKAMEAARQPYIDFERLRREAPAAAAWLSQPENMAVARDDIENLAGMDKGVQAGRESVIGRAYDWIMDFGLSKWNPLTYAPGSPLPFMRAIGGTEEGSSQRRRDKAALGGFTGSFAGMVGAVDWLLGSQLARDLGEGLRAEAQALQPENPDFLDQLASGAGSSAAFFIPGVGVASLSGLAASASVKLALWLGTGVAAVMESMTEAGSVWQESRARGNSDEDASAAASATFWYNLPLIAITNKLGVFGDRASGWLKLTLSGLLEGSQEIGQERISSDVMGEELTFRDALTVGAVGAVVGGGMGLITNSMQVAQAEQTDAQLSQTAIKAVVDTVRSSPLRNRSIEALKAYASFVAQKNGLPEYMYLPAEEVQALFQESTPEAQGLMAALGVAREDVERSLADGSDVRFLFEALPAAEALPAFERMAPLMRFRPKSVIAEELAEIEQAAAEDQRPVAAAVELDRIESEILSAGFSKRDARDTRLLYKFQSRVWADSMGRDASEVLKRVDFKRVAMTDDQARQLSQMRAKGQKGARALREMGLLDATVEETPEFKAWSGGAPVNPKKLVTGQKVVVTAFHGTADDIKAFRGGEIHLTDSARLASDYAQDAEENAYSERQRAQILPVYVRMLNPLVVDGRKGEYDFGEGYDALIAQARAAGHDGLVIQGVRDNIRTGDTKRTTNYIAFKPEQIKSVNNKGTFDLNDPRILYQLSTGSELEDFGFYSAVRQAVEAMDFKAMPAADLAARIAKTAGIKAEELEDLGLLDWLAGTDGKVTKEQVISFIAEGGPKIKEVVKDARGAQVSADARADDIADRARERYNEAVAEGEEWDGPEDFMEQAEEDWERDNPGGFAGATKFGQYVLPGGENYREILLTLPGDGYKSSHWAEANVLAHFRLNDRIDAEGRRTLFIEEIQSDWHQEGRKKGYGGPAQFLARLKTRYPSLPADPETWTLDKLTAAGATVAERETWYAEALRPSKSTPDAPFKKSWPLLAFKRVLRMAAEEGYDSVAWTPGEVQAERYDLSKQVDEIEVVKGKAGYSVTARKDSRNLIDSAFYTDDQLDGAVGKELAEKIRGQEEPEKIYSGLDLKVGGEGMKGFYDKMLPSEIGKYAKKLDKSAKVGVTRIGPQLYRRKPSWDRVDGADITTPEEGATAAPMPEVWSLPLTDQMKSAVMAGQPLYDKQTKGPRGAIFWQNSHAMIRLFETADVSTLVHETAHFFKEIMRESAADPGSPTRIQADFEEIERFVGVAKGAPWNRAQEEKFAQAFEAYILEGRAPSPELRSVFERFRQWFVQIYKTVKSLKVELTPEVRGVFNRLLATDAEIAVARAEVEGNEIFAMVEGQDDALTPQERQAYNQLRDRAHSAAAAEITARRVKELRGQEREWRADAKDLADSHPHHQAVDEIVRRGGIPRAVLAKDYDEATIKQLARLRVGLITKEGKVYPDEAAEIAGLGTADDFIEALLRLPTKKEMVEDYVAQAMAEYERGLASDAALTDEHIEMLELEARAIEAMTPRKQKVVSTPDLKKVIRRETGQVRSDKLISEATALKAAMRKAARYARDAYRAGKLEEASDWKEKQRRNALRLREVQNARRLQRQLKGYFKRIVKAKASLLVKSGLDWAFLEQIRAVVGRYGTVSGRYQAREGTPSLRDFLAAREEEGDRPFVDDWIVDDTSNRKLKDLRVDELEDLWASLRSLEAVGRNAKKVVLAGRKVSLEQASAELSGAIRKEFGEKKYDKRMLNRKAKGAGWKDSFTDWLEKAWAFPMKAEFLCRAADGFKSGGPVREAIYMRIKKASDRSYEIQEKLNKGFEAIWKPVPAKVRAAWRRKNIFVPGLPAMVFEGQTIPWTRERLLMAAMYTGQAEGVQRMEAYGINADHVQLIRETLTDKEWGLVREHWRLNEEHVSKEYAEAYEQETGVPLKLVERLDLTVRGRTFKGGYFKIQYDGALDRQAKKWQAQKEALNQPYMPHSGKVAAGSTKSRAGKVGRPLLLSFDAVGRQLAEHIHYATHNLAVRDVRKLLNDKGVRLSLETAIGPSGLAELDEWLTEVANPRRDLITPFEQIMGGLRRNSTVVMLGLKMSVTLLQFSGLTISAKEVGVGRLAQGVAEFVSGPVKAARFVWSRSPEMRARWKNLDREISDFSKWLDPTKSKIEKGKEFAFAPIAGADMLVSMPTWLGAYRAELAASGNEAKAIEAGDSAVRTTQGFGPLKDRAAAQRGGELRKLFFMFYTAMNTIGNQTQETLWAARRGKLGPVGIARNLFFLMLFPAVLEMVIRNGELPEDPEAALTAVMDFVLGQVPFVREWAPAGVAIWQRIRDRDVEWYETEVNLSPVVDALVAAARITAYGLSAVSGDLDKVQPGRLAKDVVKAAGYAAGLPASQINTTAEGAWQLLTGESDELSRLLVKGD